MELKENGKKIISKLLENGFQGYFVGGCIRDLLLKREINDIDIATDAHPEEVMSIFSRSIATGLKHGTVTVLIDNVPFEVTTFRSEGKYLDYRRPVEVSYVSELNEDLKRRDFTINAMAMTIDDRIIDPFEGRTAIHNRIITSVGDATDRFSEDPLRMFRAIRFSAQLDFVIENNTWNAIVDNSSLIRFISNERIKMEIIKIINSANPESGLNLLLKSNMIEWIKGLENIRIANTDFVAKQLLSKTDDLIIRIAILLNSFNKAEHKKIMKQLKFSNKEMNNINSLIEAIEVLQIESNNNIKKCLIKTDLRTCYRAINFLYFTEGVSLVEQERLLNEAAEIDADLIVRSSSDLDLTGRDLIDYFNWPGGPWLNSTLKLLTNKVQFEGLPNERNILLKTAEVFLDNLNKEVFKDEREN